ncbi:BZ3500_MvSof-1268-A1-R1_Chr9g10897 [Microbotryum saponariae]|uniref:BZ3500_MvSof-1268-A1-R1_Chr9g10897 protein n=1 Tax=Microbotryum saponariae TaxID=289078 RepID=A0A2X0KWB1_9BASI|nr:BZ3501_MvSof-1269-A2-R1_Chr9g10645 [Microbotryum saponariae]SDA00880.1 BZ3500_MvSof-1268-A1-R1_Chr9g10897 [Microbotryum saponariae]
MAYPPGRFSSPLDAFDYQRRKSCWLAAVAHAELLPKLTMRFLYVVASSERGLEYGGATSSSFSSHLPRALRIPIVRYLLVGLLALVGLHWLALFMSPSYAASASLEAIAFKSGLGSDGSPSSWHDSSTTNLDDLTSVGGTGLAPFEPLDPDPNAINATNKARAAFVILARNSDLWKIVGSIRQTEDRFNKNFHYPYVFLNNEPFTDEFKKFTSLLASGTCSYGQVPSDQWANEPSWIDQTKAAKARQAMVEKKILYGGSQSYRRMCRYQSGFFWRHPLLDQYDYYWRIEPGVKFFCDLAYDPFVFMRDSGKKYGWAISIYEYAETIPSLWSETQDFIHKNQHLIAPNNLIDWISDDLGKTYNLCHFWSNFEIGDLNFFRGEAYRAYFDHLDRSGGFFYERWGDAPVHSIAAALFLNQTEVHWFKDIGYRHEPFQHCPADPAERDRCSCNPADTFETHWYSCTQKGKSKGFWT